MPGIKPGTIISPSGAVLPLEPNKEYRINGRGDGLSIGPIPKPKPDHIGPAMRKIAAVVAGFLTIVFAPVAAVAFAIYGLMYFTYGSVRALGGILYHTGMYTYNKEYRSGKGERPWILRGWVEGLSCNGAQVIASIWACSLVVAIISVACYFGAACE